MQSENKFTPAQRAVRRLSELNDFAWALNRAGYRAGLHRTHPAAEWLAECGVDLSKVWKSEQAILPRIGKKQRAGFQALEKSANRRKRT